MTHLENAKHFLSIAESIEGDPKKAKKEAYRSAAEEVAAHKAETGDSIRAVSLSIRISPSSVERLLKWRESGYRDETPYSGNAKAARSVRASQAKRALRTPQERKQVVEALSEEERQVLVKDVVASASADTLDAIEEIVEKDQHQRARKRVTEGRRARQRGARPTTLSQFVARIVAKMGGEWRRAVVDIREELSTLSEVEWAQIRQAHVQLREELLTNIRVGDGQVDDDVIEGRPAGQRTLTAVP
jgi:hypothetical protein